MGLKTCENTLIQLVSGGENKRVSIANELLINPSILFSLIHKNLNHVHLNCVITFFTVNNTKQKIKHNNMHLHRLLDGNIKRYLIFS